MLDQGALAAEVAGEHPADLRDGHVRLVEDSRLSLGKKSSSVLGVSPGFRPERCRE